MICVDLQGRLSVPFELRYYLPEGEYFVYLDDIEKDYVRLIFSAKERPRKMFIGKRSITEKGKYRFSIGPLLRGLTGEKYLDYEYFMYIKNHYLYIEGKKTSE